MMNRDTKCPGCGVVITLDNVGGYRCYCEKCLTKVPPIPKDGKGHFLVGRYPNFEWMS